MVAIFIGDSGDTLGDTLMDGGDAQTLAAATSVYFHATHETGVTVSREAEIVSAEAGTVRYVTEADDFAKTGRYVVQWEVIWNNGTRSTFLSAGYLEVKQDYGS